MKKICVALFTLLLSSMISICVFAGSWEQDAKGWKWKLDNGTYAKNGWQWIDSNGDGISECYYFDSDGYCLQNTTTPDGYTVNIDGAWTVNNVVQTQTSSGTTSKSSTFDYSHVQEFLDFCNSNIGDRANISVDTQSNLFRYTIIYPQVYKTDALYDQEKQIIINSYKDAPSLQKLANICASVVGRNIRLIVEAKTGDNKVIYHKQYNGKVEEGAEDYQKVFNGQFPIENIQGSSNNVNSTINTNESAWQNFAHDQKAQSNDEVKYSFDGHTFYIDFYLTGEDSNMSVYAAKAAAATSISEDYGVFKSKADELSDAFGFKVTIVHRIYYNGQLVGSMSC